MSLYYGRKTETKILAIGIQGELSSLCGAVKRFQRRGKQWDGVLSLKEQCGRRIALLKNEQLKCFINAYLPENLFQYVTKDIFNLHQSEITSKYPRPYHICRYCVMETDDRSDGECRCPNLDAAILKLNKYFIKRMNKNSTITNQSKHFKLIYKMPKDDIAWSERKEDPIGFFLYLSPCEYHEAIDSEIDDDMDIVNYQSRRFINGQASIEEKFLFIDVMRFFGGFHSGHLQPELILSERCEIGS